MDTGESTEEKRIYPRSIRVELRGLFYGPINAGAGGSMTKRTEILEWISTVPYTNHHKRISDDRIEGIGEWILKEEKYRAWKESTNSMLLLLRGISGAGKTYIASQVIDSFLSNATPESKLAYFYCNRAEESRRDPKSILRAIVRQLAQTPANDELLSPVLDIYKCREKAGQLTSRLTLGECRDLLVQLVSVYPQATICIDAVDEVNQQLRMELLEVLRHVVERSNTQVKIFATTRMDIDIHLQFERIELEPDNNVDDIKRYVEKKVQSMIERKRLLDGNVPKTLKDEICQVLCERSKGIFQLAALHLTLLCDMAIPGDIKASLKVLPETLTDAYGEIYNRIREQKGSAPRLALNAFRWVLCSYEPLQSETLLDAVTVEVDGSGEFFPKFTALRAADLLKVCKNLLILDERLNVFRFAHLSVEDYLVTQQLYVDPHSELAKICLSLVCSSRSWMGYEAIVETREGHLYDRPLLLYAAVFWPWHLSRCKDSCQILTALHIAAENGHNELAKLSENRGAFRYGRTALHAVANNEHEALAQLLGAPGADPLATEGDGWTPLHAAAQKGDLAVARQLVDRGANASAANKDGWTPLHAAVQNRNVVLARLLADRGADISAANSDGWTPLHEAAHNGHEALARLLADRGAEMSAANTVGWTPLHAATKNGNVAVARVLVDRGADVSAANRDGWTPLHAAVQKGDLAVARLLVDRGADASPANKDRWTPLHAAVQTRNVEVARLLADRGADISATNRDGWTPLHEAAHNGDEALARLLVDRGADMLATNIEGWTPRHIAAQNGREALAQLLVAATAPLSSP